MGTVCQRTTPQTVTWFSLGLYFSFLKTQVEMLGEMADVCTAAVGAWCLEKNIVFSLWKRDAIPVVLECLGLETEKEGEVITRFTFPGT